jgi:hypothetical protein
VSLTVQVDEIHAYAPQAETLVAGLYDGSNSLMKAVTLKATRGGWQVADFPATLKAGQYYLAESGTASSVNLSAGEGVSCLYDTKGALCPSFQPSGSLPSGLPLYLTGCRPQAIQGLLFGLGASILGGDNRTGGGEDFMELFRDWLNKHYGPVQESHNAADGLDSTILSGTVENRLAGVTMNLCVLEIGMKNLESSGGPDSSNCGGASMVSAFSSALRFGEDLQYILPIIRSHLAPGGMILMTNLYEVDDYSEAIHPGWKDYHRVLRMYNDIMAMVAKANGAKLIDAHTVMASDPAYRDSLNMHPNSAGHSAIAVLLEKAVAEAPLAPEGKTPAEK